MDKKTLKIIKLMWQIIQNKKRLLFWFTVRFFSVFLPLLTIYLFSKVINLVEIKADFSAIFFLILVTLAIKIVDNFSRLRSVTKLDECISEISFDIHNYFIKDLKSETKLERNESIQAIRNFADATALTLKLLRQPGIDSIISLITIPFIMLSVDARISILEVVYIIVYFVIDYYTTQRYVILKDFQNTKVESYYAKLQETNDIELEQKTFDRHFTRLSNWFFTEWFTLQNTAVFFYILIFVYLIISVYTGTKLISDLILVMTYVTSTQTYLNSSSEVKDSLADVDVAVNHLAKNKSITVIDFDDLV